MVLDRYFTAREKLRATLPAAKAVRPVLDAQQAPALNRAISAISRLPKSFRVVVIGAQGAGKHELVTAWEKHANAAERIEWEMITLTDDEPGHSRPASRRTCIERAHAALVLIDAVNPWEQRPFDFLAKLPPSWLKKVIVAVSHSELRERQELTPLCRHIAVELRTATGNRLDPIAVSARLAGEGSGSGLDRLGQAITRAVQIQSACERKLAKAVSLANTALEHIATTTLPPNGDAPPSGLDRLDLDRAIDSHEADTKSRLHAVAGKIDAAFMDAFVDLEKAVGEDCVLRSLASQGERFQNRVREAVIATLEAAAGTIEENLNALWRDLISLEKSEGTSEEPANDELPDWSEPRRAFVKASAKSAVSAVQSIELKEVFQCIVGRRRAFLRRTLLAAILISVVLAAALWKLVPEDFTPVAIGSGCALVWLGSGALYIRGRRRWKTASRQILWDYLDEQRDLLQQTVSHELEEHPRVYYSHLRIRLSEWQDTSAQSREQAPSIDVSAKFEELVQVIREIGNGLTSDT